MCVLGLKVVVITVVVVDEFPCYTLFSSVVVDVFVLYACIVFYTAYTN